MKLVVEDYSEFRPTAEAGFERYARACANLGLEPIPAGYGFLECRDQETGDRWTRITDDLEFHRVLFGEANGNLPRRLGTEDALPASTLKKYAKKRRGWPADWGLRTGQPLEVLS